MKKVPAYEAPTVWNRVIYSNCFQNTDQILFVFVYFSIFWLTVSKRVSREIFLDITIDTVDLWDNYVLKPGNPL